jgi:Rod binding domain-containing protein
MTSDIKNAMMPSPGLRLETSTPSFKSPTTSGEIKKMAQEFSSLLLSELLKSMRATLSNEGLDGDSSSARESYMSLADVEVTRSLAKQDGMGLTAFLERALSKLTPKSDAQDTPHASAYENGISVDPQALLSRGPS